MSSSFPCRFAGAKSVGLCLFLVSVLIGSSHGGDILKQARTVFCPPATKAPKIDGDLSDACWEKATVESHFFRHESQMPARTRTEVLSVRDDAALYFAVRAYSGNLDAMRAEAKKRDGGVWVDDSIEIFLQHPSNVVYHIIVNSAGMLYDARSDTKPSGWDPPIEVACKVVREDGRTGYWTAEMAIPWKELGGAPQADAAWKANFTRTDTNRGELSTWSIIEKGGFEQPERFGGLFFRPPTEAEAARREAFLKAFAQPEETGDSAALVAIPLKPSQWTQLRKVPVRDCRVLRAFVGEPVDGCTRSKGYSGAVAEYPGYGVGAGINYSYNRNDGVHVTLADKEGFDTVVLRGGARTEMFVDVPGILAPADGKPVWRFAGKGELEVARFDPNVKAERISFLHCSRGSMADVAFYQTTRLDQAPTGEVWSPRAAAATLADSEEKLAPESVFRGLQEFYADGERQTFALQPGDNDAPLPFAKGKAVHLMTEPLNEEKGIASLSIEAKVEGVQPGVTSEVALHDPLNPRRDLVSAAFLLAQDGRTQLNLDFPDQVLLKGSRIWLTLRFDADGKLVGPKGGAPSLTFRFLARDEAVAEALAWRKLVLRTLYGPLSEPRPWGGFTKQTSRQQFYASSSYASQCPELFMTIDQCAALDPADDLSRQYREWVFLRHLDQLSTIDPPAAPPEGVPAWAWYPRLAWLEIRRMADWWMTERLAPTGEIGGAVGDDTDFYQQFADIPYFERGGVAPKVLDACQRLAELAQKENLEGGINRQATDSLHAYEEGINHLALMARWHYGDPIYLERCMESGRNMEKLTIVTADRRRHFRDSSRMGSEDTKKPREPGVDGDSCPLMWHTAFQVADYNRDPTVLKVLREWVDTWLKFQKPNEWATAIEVATGKVVASRPDRPLSGGYRSQAVSFLWMYALTRDPKYAEPFLHFLRQAQVPYPLNTLMSDLCALGLLDGLDEKARAGLAASGNAAAALELKGDPAPFLQQTIGSPRNGDATIDNLHDARRFPDMYTTAHQYTDRVFLGDLLARASEAYLGGYCKRNKYNPVHAVSWEGFGIDYAALVLSHRWDRLKVAVYSYAAAPMRGLMRVWALDHGRYRISQGIDTDRDFKIDQAAQTTEKELVRADGIEVVLEPGRVTVVEVSQLEELDSIFQRPDLAIAAREVEIAGRTIKGIVHNIGGSEAGEAVVAILDVKGATLAQKSLGKLPAPLDLVPSRVAFSVDVPGGPQKGWKLVLDPAKAVPEIYEGNNEVSLDGLPATDYSKGFGDSAAE